LGAEADLAEPSRAAPYIDFWLSRAETSLEASASEPSRAEPRYNQWPSRAEAILAKEHCEDEPSLDVGSKLASLNVRGYFTAPHRNLGVLSMSPDWLDFPTCPIGAFARLARLGHLPDRPGRQLGPIARLTMRQFCLTQETRCELASQIALVAQLARLGQWPDRPDRNLPDCT
jgi:hypothetical protein